MNKLLENITKSDTLLESDFERKGNYHCPFCFQWEELERVMVDHRNNPECAALRDNIRIYGKEKR